VPLNIHSVLAVKDMEVEIQELVGEQLQVEVVLREDVDVPNKQAIVLLDLQDLQDNLDYQVMMEPLENLERQVVLDQLKLAMLERVAASNAKQDLQDQMGPTDLQDLLDQTEIPETMDHQEKEDRPVVQDPLEIKAQVEIQEPLDRQDNQARQAQNQPQFPDPKVQVDHQDLQDNLDRPANNHNQELQDQQAQPVNPEVPANQDPMVNPVDQGKVELPEPMQPTVHVHLAHNPLLPPVAALPKVMVAVQQLQLPLQSANKVPNHRLLLQARLLVVIVVVLQPFVELLLVNKQ